MSAIEANHDCPVWVRLLPLIIVVMVSVMPVKSLLMEKVRLKNAGDSIFVCYLYGRLDVAISGEIEEQLVTEIDTQHVKHLVLNMADVEYMSSSGFRVTIALLRKLKDLGGSLRICNIRPAVKRIFDVIELTTLFDIYETEEAAISAIKA